MSIDYSKKTKYQLHREDHEMLKLKPYSLFVAAEGQFKKDQEIYFYSKHEHLEDNNFTGRFVKDIQAGIRPGTELLELWDIEFLEIEKKDKLNVLKHQLEIDEMHRKRDEDIKYKEALFLQCKKDMEEF